MFPSSPSDSARTFETLLQNWPVLLTSLLVSGFLLGMFVYAVFLYFRRTRHNWKTRWLAGIYIGAALPAGIITMALTIDVLTKRAPAPGESPDFTGPMVLAFALIGGLIGLAVEVGKGLVYTGAGEVLAVRLRQPSLPYLRGWLRRRRRKQAGRTVSGGSRLPWATVLLASAAVIGYTAGLFWLTSPRISPLIRNLLPGMEADASSLGRQLLYAWVFSLLAIKEEIVFRLFLQGAFEHWLRRVRGGWLWAILLSSAVWTLAHSGAVEPAWVKYAQIMPIGILLGLMRRRWGIESTILVHVALNVAAVFLLEGFCRS
ncbi:MAG TPA: CPBP family intramembrane metalloprotease [Planctomycetota bacterium]|nr:CPBP family intramembrane metalloprotease [Planctomycetota bacterium]